MKPPNLLQAGGLAFIFLLGLLFSFILFYEASPPKPNKVVRVGQFELPNLHTGDPIRNSELRFPALLNVWASWCVSCRYEHALLMELHTSHIPIYGINYLDERQDALEWLHLRGDPYVMNIYDAKGTLGIELGIYGVPETFLIDRNGNILVHHLGILTEKVWQEKFLPFWQSS